MRKGQKRSFGKAQPLESSEGERDIQRYFRLLVGFLDLIVAGPGGGRRDVLHQVLDEVATAGNVGYLENNVAGA